MPWNSKLARTKSGTAQTDLFQYPIWRAEISRTAAGIAPTKVRQGTNKMMRILVAAIGSLLLTPQIMSSATAQEAPFTEPQMQMLLNALNTRTSQTGVTRPQL